MIKPYKYHLRLGYGSDKLLFQFFLDSTDTEFHNILFTALKDINPKANTIEDFWMNDEVLLHVSSDKGPFTLSKDIWGFVFIVAENNQPCIKFIDEILNANNLFQKEEVNL